jgi:hypothetical protein
MNCRTRFISMVRVLIAVLAAVGISAGGCGVTGVVGDDEPPDTGDTSNAGSDAQSSLCPGQCVPAPPDGWTMGGLLWHGPPEEEPPCPASAPLIGYHGNADLVTPPMSCGECACDPPTGECRLPSYMVARTSKCNLGGDITPFAPQPIGTAPAPQRMRSRAARSATGALASSR